MAAKGGKTLTALSVAVLRVMLTERESMPVSELAGLIRDYRDRYEITRRPFGGYQAQRRPKRARPVIITADTAAEMRLLLGPPDDIAEAPETDLRVTVSVYLRSTEAERFMAAEPGDPEQWELANVSTGERFSPYGLDCAEDDT